MKKEKELTFSDCFSHIQYEFPDWVYRVSVALYVKDNILVLVSNWSGSQKQLYDILKSERIKDDTFRNLEINFIESLDKERIIPKIKGER